MAIVIDADELRARLEEFLARAGRGERIWVRAESGEVVVLGRADSVAPPDSSVRTPRRRFRSERTVAEVLAEDRGA